MLRGCGRDSVRGGRRMTDIYQTDLTAGAPDWPVGKKWHWHEQVLYTFPAQWWELAQLGLSSTQYRVLLALLACCDWGNRCRATCAYLWRRIGLHRSTVSRILRTLVARQLCYIESAPGQRDHVVVLSPALAWKGRPWHLSYARDAFLAAWRLRALASASATSSQATDALASHPRVRVGSEPPPTRSRIGGAAPFLPHPPFEEVGPL